MPTVKFIKEKIEITVPDGANLRDEAVKAGVNLNQGVNGIGATVNRYANCSTISMGFLPGICGTCRVKIVKGMQNTNAFTKTEFVRFKVVPLPEPMANLAYIGNEATMRLACCTTVHGDIEVESGPEVNFFGENFFS